MATKKKTKAAPSIMKLSANSADLQKYVNSCCGVISSNPVLPILDSLLIRKDEFNKSSINIIGTNLKTTMQFSLEVNLDTSLANYPDGIAVPAKLFNKTLKALPLHPVTLDAKGSDDGHKITLTSAYGTYELQGWDAGDYPDAQDMSDSTSIALPSIVLKEAIDRTRWCVSTDELRPAMTGVLFSIDQQGITMVGTDAHRLASYHISAEEVPGLDLTDIVDPVSIIIPGSSLKLVSSMLVSTEEAVEIEFNDSSVRFNMGHAVLTCRIIDTRYPDYKAIVPTTSDKELIIDRPALINSVKRIVEYANRSTNQVLFDIVNAKAGATLSIGASDLDHALRATETLAADAIGIKKFKIGFNGKYLIECLSTFTSENVTLMATESNHAAMIYESESDECFGNYFVLIMPVML